MQTKAQVVAALKANLADPRCMAICLFIEEMLERKNAKASIPRWRVKNKLTNTDITSVGDVIAAIIADHVTLKYPFGTIVHQTDRVTGYNVRATNIEVTFMERAEDDFINGEFLGGNSAVGSVFNFQFHMAYLNDADSDMPVKVVSIRLVS